MRARRILYPVGAALALWLAFTAGRLSTTERWTDAAFHLCEDRGICLPWAVGPA